MDAGILLKCNLFLLYLRDIVEYFQESNETFWSDFVVVDFKRKLKSHGMKDGCFKTMDIGSGRSHGNYIVCFSVGSHWDEVLKSADNWEWKDFGRR